MEYLEAVAIKRLRPDSLPPNLVHLLDEAERVIKLKQAMCSGAVAVSDRYKLELPVLSAQERARVNAVLLHNLAMECGKLEAWGGPKRQRGAMRPIELRKGDLLPGPPIPAGPGAGGFPWEQVR